ncbi:palindromic element RPE5 domain-containing protein [Rickettsia japonica]|uniref:Palindromic element RPE5 domain-containing protein n=1 Tax=Rickettsia japonica TaxID=35790 RepID=A0ABN5P2F0_RICJA|nr:palindromic element RPE5 domain-containing protein [Rickettsia japonica]QHE25508.1 palindromic element RPE5 domain-containing protein [Rickettsia japonica]
MVVVNVYTSTQNVQHPRTYKDIAANFSSAI